eukprot:jgi/Ulvmu1/822/UM010_0196.1
MSAMSQRPLETPAAATTAIFTFFSIYYLFAAEHVVEMSVSRYSHFDRPLSDVLSLVPSGLVRKRGVLFLADVLYIQLASSVEKAHEGMTAFVWALRLVLGAAQAYYNVAVDTAMWRPWPGIAEVLTMSGLALLWIRATLQASSNSQRRATADILDSADVPETFTGGGSKAKGTARKAGTSTSPADTIPTPVFVVLMAAAALSSLGLGIMLRPDIAVQQLVADTFHQHHAAVEAAVATPAAGTRHSAIILFKAVHLSTSRCAVWLFHAVCTALCDLCYAVPGLAHAICGGVVHESGRAGRGQLFARNVILVWIQCGYPSPAM